MTSATVSPGREPPRVAVLLLNWNGWLDTIECLESLFRMDHPICVVLCDNASTDGSIERFRDWAAGKDVPTLPTPDAIRHLVAPPVPKPVVLLEYSRLEAEQGVPAI